MQVQEIMTKDVSCGSPGTNAAAAAEIMWARNCGSLPIVEDDGRVVGMVTDRDLFIALGTQNRRASDLVVGEIMHREFSACAPEDDVRHALKTMAKQRVQRLPVVDASGAIKGIISIDDVVVRTNAAFKDDTIRTLRLICERLAPNSRQEALQSEPATA